MVQPNCIGPTNGNQTISKEPDGWDRRTCHSGVINSWARTTVQTPTLRTLELRKLHAPGNKLTVSSPTHACHPALQLSEGLAKVLPHSEPAYARLRSSLPQGYPTERGSTLVGTCFSRWYLQQTIGNQRTFPTTRTTMWHVNQWKLHTSLKDANHTAYLHNCQSQWHTPAVGDC